MAEGDLILSLFNRYLGASSAVIAPTIIIKKDIFEKFLRGAPKEVCEELLRMIPLTPPDIMSNEFCFWVRDCREILGLTQAQLAECSGIAQAALSTFERGVHKSFGFKRREKLVHEFSQLVQKRSVAP